MLSIKPIAVASGLVLAFAVASTASAQPSSCRRYRYRKQETRMFITQCTQTFSPSSWRISPAKRRNCSTCGASQRTGMWM